MALPKSRWYWKILGSIHEKENILMTFFGEKENILMTIQLKDQTVNAEYNSS